MILILEDDQDRIDRFTAVLQTRPQFLPLIIWKSATKMIAEVEKYFDQVDIISLDHDLEPQDGDVQDPGNGYDVVKFLCKFDPVCPVIIHTSNGTRADWMQGEFDLCGWNYKRVAPLGDDWIESYWFKILDKLYYRKLKNR